MAVYEFWSTYGNNVFVVVVVVVVVFSPVIFYFEIGKDHSAVQPVHLHRGPDTVRGP